MTPQTWVQMRFHSPCREVERLIPTLKRLANHGTSLTRWWFCFKDFLFLVLLGEMIELEFDEYFSNGLKPATYSSFNFPVLNSFEH